MKKLKPIIDEKNYTVAGINGFRRGCLTREQAFSLAKRMQEQMREAGWAGEMKVYYRDVTECKPEV